MFDSQQYEKTAELLGAIKGKLLLSIYDTSQIRAWFGGFYIDEVRLTYTIAKQGTDGKASELIISNWQAVTGLI